MNMPPSRRARQTTLTLLLMIMYAGVAFAQTDPHTQRERDMSLAWSQELARWPLYCLSRARTSADPRAGCGDPIRATQARWALLRQRRVTGHGGAHLDPQGQALLNPSAWWSLPPHAQGENLSARVEERAWRLALTYESLMSTGDAGWLVPLWGEMASLTSEASAHCVAETASSPACLSALYWLGSIARTPWREANPALFPILHGASKASDTARREAWAQHWGQLLAWVRGQAGELFPTVHLSRGASHNAWVMLLASVTLETAELTKWVTYWRAQQGLLPPTSGSTDQGSLMAIQGLALAQLSARLGDRALGEVAQRHLRQAVSAYLSAPRDPALRSQLAMRGLWALSGSWETPHIHPKTGEVSGGFGLSYPPRLWRHTDLTLKLDPLPTEGLTAQGMFSKIRVRDRGVRRGMYFVRPGGVEVLESELDLAHPELLQVAYTRDFLLSYALTPQHKRALIVGLGGGGMLHALKRYDPTLNLEVVEIDPVVVKLARERFAVESTGAQLITRDGFEQLRDPKSGQYDVIYMDAFLQPSDETDSTGAPLRLKTVAFLKEVRARLTRQGVLMVNLNEHPQVAQDIRSIQGAFESTLVWRVPQTGNLIVAGFNGAPNSAKVLYQRALEREGSLNGPVRLAPILTRALRAEGI